MACTAILNPRDDVQRCGSASDCDPIDDERYVAECRFDPENVDLDTSETDKVCVPAFRVVSCDPRNLPPNHGLKVAFDERAKPSTYTGCSETPGVRGCPPGMTGCEAGLMPVQVADTSIELCDDDDPNTPPAYANAPGLGFADPEPEGLVGQDVLDQYCRGFFCDESWVCDKSTYTCKPCDSDEAFGEGGCGEIYVGGELSCAYLDGNALMDACAGEDAQLDEYVGGCPEL